MKLRRRKAPPTPPLPERDPDLILGGKPCWVAKANPDALARIRAEERERAIERARMRMEHPPPFHLWMDI